MKTREFGTGMKSFRISRGLTQRQFGERMDATATQVSQWERGAMPTAKVLARLKEAYGIDPLEWTKTDPKIVGRPVFIIDFAYAPDEIAKLFNIGMVTNELAG